MKLVDRSAIVTGAGAGIGEAYAHALAAQGASVVVADIEAEAAEAVAEQLVAQGGAAIAVRADVTSETDVEALADEALAAHGRIDILVNNAGLASVEASAPCATMERSLWRRLLDVNVTGALNCAVACRPSLAQSDAGVIINQSSVAAYMGTPSAYGVSKLALNGLTAALAAEFAADGIRVNGIAPSTMESATRPAMRAFPEEMRQAFLQQQLIRRFGRMEELAELLVFLCSDQSRFVTGQTWLFDGGLVRRP